MSEAKPFSIPDDPSNPDCAECGCPESQHIGPHIGPGPAGGMRPCAGRCRSRCENFIAPGKKEAVEHVNHPSHYGGDKTYEAIRIIEAMGWGEGFNKGNALKYLVRAGNRADQPEERDLRKAVWYLKREIQRIQVTDDV